MGKSRQLSYANEKSVSSCKRVKGGRLRELGSTFQHFRYINDINTTMHSK